MQVPLVEPTESAEPFALPDVVVASVGQVPQVGVIVELVVG